MFVKTIELGTSNAVSYLIYMLIICSGYSLITLIEACILKMKSIDKLTIFVTSFFSMSCSCLFGVFFYIVDLPVLFLASLYGWPILIESLIYRKLLLYPKKDYFALKTHSIAFGICVVIFVGIRSIMLFMKIKNRVNHPGITHYLY